MASKRLLSDWIVDTPHEDTFLRARGKVIGRSPIDINDCIFLVETEGKG